MREIQYVQKLHILHKEHKTIRIDYMKSRTEYFFMNTADRYAIVDITRQVDDAVKKSGIKEGLCLVNALGCLSSGLR